MATKPIDDEDDELDKLMPDPDTGDDAVNEEELEIEIADDGVVAEEAPEGEASDENADDGVSLASEEEEEEETKDEPLPKNQKEFKDRLAREQRLRRRQVESEKQARLVIEEQARASEAERAELQSEVLNVKIVAMQLLAQKAESDIALLTQQITIAKEGGKTEDEVRLQAALTDAQASLREAKANQATLEQQKKEPPKATPRSDNPYTTTWKGGNTWFNNNLFGVERAAVLAIDAELLAGKKFDPRSSAYYEELDKRIAAKFPGLRANVTKAGLTMTGESEKPRQGGRGEARRTPVRPAAPRQPGGDLPKSKSKVVLTQSDLDNMRQFRMDPNNPEHVKSYAREKLTAGD